VLPEHADESLESMLQRPTTVRQFVQQHRSVFDLVSFVHELFDFATTIALRCECVCIERSFAHVVRYGLSIAV
jgi:hypothetical protein